MSAYNAASYWAPPCVRGCARSGNHCRICVHGGNSRVIVSEEVKFQTVSMTTFRHNKQALYDIFHYVLTTTNTPQSSITYPCAYSRWLRHLDFFFLCELFSSKKYPKAINPLCAGNNVFVTYQAQRGFNPNPLSPRSLQIWAPDPPWESGWDPALPAQLYWWSGSTFPRIRNTSIWTWSVIKIIHQPRRNDSITVRIFWCPDVFALISCS